ncbi:MAG: DUF4348 domain-containing protein [Alloprevotella sp.]
MKNFILFLAVLLTIPMSCKRTTDEPKRETVPQDTVASADTVAAADTTSVLPPKVADELFDDFIYSFMKSKRFQLSRISFPLPFNSNDEARAISVREWKFDPLFSRQETYTVIYHSEKEMKAEKDTAVSAATFEWIYLSKKKTKQYFFRRIRGTWMLTGIREGSWQQHDDSDFYEFYRRFATDDAFQLSHVKDPFRFKTYDDNSFSQIEGVLDRQQWLDFRPDLPKHTMTNIVYGSSVKEQIHGKRILTVCSASGGMGCVLSFAPQHDSWVLESLEN